MYILVRNLEYCVVRNQILISVMIEIKVIETN